MQNMNFEQLTERYFQSPEYSKLELQTKRMYSKYISRLVVLGGSLPIVDDKPIAVAVARSRRGVPKPVAPNKNLPRMWYDLIDGYISENGEAATTTPTLAKTLAVHVKAGIMTK